MFNRLYLLTAGLILLTLGCGLLTPEATSTPAPTSPAAEPTAEPAAPIPTATPTQNEESAEDIIPLPVMDDASEAEDFFGLYSYVTAYSVEEIVAFYEQELTGMGMSVASESVGNDFAVLSFAREDDNPLTLNVITNDAGLREVRLAD